MMSDLRRKQLNIIGAYIVRSNEGTGLPHNLRNLSIEQIRKITVDDWRNMSDWIPTDEREHLASFYGDIPHRLNRNYAPDDVRKLLDHAVEADRRIAERDDLLKEMAAALSIGASTYRKQECRAWEFECDTEFPTEKSCGVCRFDYAANDALNKYETLLEGTT